MRFEKLIDNLYRLCVPFENIYTSVFAITVDENCIIFDSASGSDDVEKYIYPAIKKAGFFPTQIIISHSHRDHSGGLASLAAHFPHAGIGMFFNSTHKNAKILEDGELLFNTIKVFNLKGHSKDSLAALDLRTNTLLTFDCVQLLGIDRYRSGITDKDEYLKSLNRLKNLNAENLIASHDYDPLGFSAFGKNAVLDYLNYPVNI